jgi:hypothetical protein
VTGLLPTPLIIKEGRALAPIWLAAVVSIVAGVKTGDPSLALFAFVLGAVALGVFSIGHEYAHRTLTSLLAQPVSRTRLLLSKAIVLVLLLALLTIVAALTLPAETMARWLGAGTAARPSALAVTRWRLALLVLTPALGLCVAPWLTMLCRSVIGGVVFTLAVPASLWIAGQIARVVAVGFVADPLAYGPTLTMMIVGVGAVVVVAAVHARWLFVGLEALDVPRELTHPAMMPARVDSGAVRLQTRVQPRGAVGRRPLALLLQKEIRLHALAFAVAVLYALGWFVLWLTRADSYIAGQSFMAITGLYGVFIAILVGATASAEERGFGTAEWHILQPYAFWKQWLAKLFTLGALALVLGLVVPILLETVFPLIRDSGAVGPRVYLPFLAGLVSRPPAAMLMVALVGFYGSTLSVGALRALLTTLPLASVLLGLYSSLAFATYRFEIMVLQGLYGAPRRGQPWWWKNLATASWDDVIRAYRVSQWMSAAIIAAFVVLLLRLAFHNSRSAERGMTMARRQVPWIVAYVATAAIMARGAPALLEWWLLTH